MDQPLKPIIVILGVLAIGFLLWTWLLSERGNQNIPEGIQQEQPIATTTSNVVLSIHAVKPGDKVGDFTLENIHIFPFVYPDGRQDFIATYTGETTVSGEYWWSHMLGRVCFDVGGTDTHKIPRLAEDGKNVWFCFADENTEFAEQALAPDLDASVSGDGVKHSATVTIRNYTERVAAKEGSDSTELVRVVSQP